MKNNKDFVKSGNTLKVMIKEKHIPRYIYKYSKISNNLKESLLNSELWFATPGSFNDPFDCQYDDQTDWNEDNVRRLVRETIKITGEKINPEDVVRISRKNPEIITDFVSKNIKEVTKNKGLFCCSASPKKALMWAHYADSHKGVCLKLDISKDVDLFEFTHPVKYYYKYPKFDYFKKNGLVNRILAKSSDWKYEDEIRTIQDNSGLYKFNKECLKEVIFGKIADEREIEIIRKIVENNYDNVKFKRIRFKKNSYRFMLEKI